MAADSGFITNATAVTTIQQAHTVGLLVKLEALKAADAKSEHGQLPASGARWSHLALRLDRTAGTPVTCTARIYEDSTGDDLVAGPTQSAFTLAPGLTTTTSYSVVIPLDDIVPTDTAQRTATGEVYVSVAVDAGTVTVPIAGAKLFWNSVRRQA